MSAALESARRQWEQGYRRLEAEAVDPRRHDRQLQALDALGAELRKRVGQSFTLEQLARAYERAEAWSRDAIAEGAPYPGWDRDASLLEDAAFHLYSRGAQDWAP